MGLLADLAKKHGTDKYEHGFCPFYETFFGPIRESVERVLEIGVMSGCSLRVWLDYFPNAKVYGLDNQQYVNPEAWPEDDRCEVFIGDSGDRRDLARAMELSGGGFDLILDDASHTMHDQQTALGFLFRYVKPGGYYIVEDLDSSFFVSQVLVGPAKGYAHMDVVEVATGVDGYNTTTYDLLKAMSLSSAMALAGRLRMSMGEQRFLFRNYEWVKIFQRDPDVKQHITSIIKRRGGSETDCKEKHEIQSQPEDE